MRDEGATSLRDTTCGTPDLEWIGREVRLTGWVHRRRDLGGVHFFELRDRTGRVQLALKPERGGEELMAAAGELSPEDVVSVRGEVARRPDDAVNPDLSTGRVEIHVTELERLSASDDLPILVAVPPEEELPSEELRLRHRFLDLRRPEMLRNFEVRHRALTGAREVLDAEGFVEVETPLLTRRTPEGARDYLVPSRVHPGEFYALPQSPQLYKQILMVSGFDRYYQLTRCLRDEDLRADRQPEFSQIDVEMSFVDEEDVFGACERMLAGMWREGVGVEIETPFPRLTYAEAMERYGTDKPDLRIPWELQDFTETLTGIGFRIFDGAVDAGGRVRGLVVEGGSRLSRSDLDALDDLAREHGAKGSLWLRRDADGWSGPPASCVDDDTGRRLASQHGVEEGDLILLVAGEDAVTSGPLDVLRRRAAREMDAVEADGRWAWVTDYPLFEEDPDTGRPVPSHHPFTLPRAEDVDRLETDPLSVRSHAYDVVLDGWELCSGSLRCHDAELQRRIFDVLGLSREETSERFGFLLEAFRYGVPPHGGYALGLDRTVALMVGATSIREVIVFPKTTAARGLMEGAPTSVPPEELAELGLALREPRTSPGA
ncbi:MAG: aspartate--tRNA ligase [Gemmatimonadota bacterium]